MGDTAIAAFANGLLAGLPAVRWKTRRSRIDSPLNGYNWGAHSGSSPGGIAGLNVWAYTSGTVRLQHARPSTLSITYLIGNQLEYSLN
jgi:hypothetical protein